MASISGARFAQIRTPENFRAWATEEPQAAATWLGKVARSIGTSDVFSAGDPKKLGDAFDALAAKSIGVLQTARVATIGWETPAPRGDAPAITGTLELENGEPVLNTPAGKFSMVNADFMNQEAGWWANYFLGGHDVAAFAGQTVTVKGWPDESWSPGSAAKLVVEEFAPGSSGDFVSGRVLSKDGEVFIRVRPGKDVKIIDPELKKQLAPYDRLGVILPGAPEKSGDAYAFAGNPEGYYVLAGFKGSGAPAGGKTPVSFFGAHGSDIPGNMQKAAFDAGPPRKDRHYVFGQFVNGQLEAKGYTPFAGQWAGASQTVAKPSAQFAEWATPIEPPPPSPFAPAPPPEFPSAESLLQLTADQRWAGYQVGTYEMKRGFGQVYPDNLDKLGRPLEEEHEDGMGGAVQRFERGTLHWSPDKGLRVVPMPTQAELVALTQDNRWQGYEVGQFSLVRGFAMVYPEFADRLGRPLENEHGDGSDGALQKFEKGVMTWNPRDGVRAVPNA